MYKPFANFICAFIPSLELRHRVREKLTKKHLPKEIQDQLTEAKLIAENALSLAESAAKFERYLSAAVIIKDEAKYMAEWLEYHILVGVEHFYIYDNGSTDNIKEVLKPYIKAKLVDYIPFPGKAMQSPAYADAIKNYKNDTRWLAFLDADEFIVPKSTKDIPSLLKTLEFSPALVIKWLEYGSSGHKKQTDGLVIERFKSHSEDRVVAVKSIVNPRLVKSVGAHRMSFLGLQKEVNPLGIALPDGFWLAGTTIEGMHVNHYVIKSYEEFMEKKLRGTANSETFRIPENDKFWKSYLTQHDKNEIQNDPMMDKYVPLVKAAIKKRFA